MLDIENQDHGNNVFVFTETITPKEGRADDVLAISLKSVDALKVQKGMIQSMVTKSEKSGGEICTISVWSSKTDFQNFMKTDEFSALLKSDDMENVKSWMSNYDMLMSELVEGWHG